MQMRCSYCQTMFAISHEETLAAIEHMADNDLKYYDAHCPNCRRANRVERFKLEASYPGWQQAIKTMVKAADKADAREAKEAAAEAAPAKKPAAASTAKSAPAKKPAAKTASAAKAKAAPVKKPAAASTAKVKKK